MMDVPAKSEADPRGDGAECRSGNPDYPRGNRRKRTGVPVHRQQPEAHQLKDAGHSKHSRPAPAGQGGVDTRLQLRLDLLRRIEPVFAIVLFYELGVRFASAIEEQSL